jgi:hypothetical protein
LCCDSELQPNFDEILGLFGAVRNLASKVKESTQEATENDVGDYVGQEPEKPNEEIRHIT